MNNLSRCGLASLAKIRRLGPHISLGDYFQGESAEWVTDTTAYTFTETTTENERENIRAAVSDWEEDSSGVSESRTFAIQPSLDQGAVSEQHLLSLQLECLEETEASQV